MTKIWLIPQTLYQFISVLIRIPTVLTRGEKRLIAALSGIILICFGIIYFQMYLFQTELVPRSGGTYIEGVVAESSADVEKDIVRLTSAGLTRIDSGNNLQGDLAERWEIAPDGKMYTFYLRGGISATEIKNIVTSQNVWPEVEILSPNEQTIQLKFQQKSAHILRDTSRPIFPYGPYRIKSQSEKKIVLAVNPDYKLGKPWIDKIIIDIFTDEQKLQRALDKGQIMGALKVNGDKGFISYEFQLPRYTTVIFNLTREVFKDKTLRQKLAANESLGKEVQFNLVTSNSEIMVKKAEEIVNKWQQLGAKITIIKKDSVTLQQEVIPKRDFDALLFGLDYGRDPDPYPFWHSSQVPPPGNNLASFVNEQADKILQEARQEEDFGKRLEKYQEFDKILKEEMPAIFLEQQSWRYKVYSGVKGIKIGACISPTDRFGNIWEWYIKEKRVRK